MAARGVAMRRHAMAMLSMAAAKGEIKTAASCVAGKYVEKLKLSMVA